MNRGEVEEIVQTTVRKINSGPEACLTNPRVLAFFNIMKDSFYRCLKAQNAADLAAAVLSITTWDSARIAEEVELIVKRYPSVKDSYTYAAVYIVEQTYKKDNGQLKLKLPSFQSFMYTFYTTLLNSEPFQRGTFDTLQFFEKEMVCCQAFCNALYSSIRTEPIVKPQSVIIEPSAVVAPVQTGAAASSKVNRKSASQAPEKASSVLERSSQVSSASRFSRRALAPQDSVSQLKRSVLDSKPTTFRGLLTEEFLNQHRKQQSSSPASEAAASIKKAASKKSSVRVVDIEEHPQKHLVGGGDSTDDSSSRTSNSTSNSSNDKLSFDFGNYSHVDPHKARHVQVDKLTGREDRRSGREDKYSGREERRDVSSRERDDHRHHSDFLNRRADQQERTGRHNPNRRH